jgi:hypothetical protein
MTPHDRNLIFQVVEGMFFYILLNVSALEVVG